MAKTLPRIALDSCVIIDAIIKNPANYGYTKEIIDRAVNGELEIVVSTASLPEVHFLKLESNLDQDTQNAMIDRWFDNPFVIKVSVDPGVGKRAATICREHNATPIDAMIVASALTGKADILVTTDCKKGRRNKTPLIALNGKVGDPPLAIVEPADALNQKDLFYGSEKP